MKYWFILLGSLLIARQNSAEVFTRYLEKNKPSNIEIYEKDKLHVNESCYRHFDECIRFLKVQANSKLFKKKNTKYVGHPASDFCQNSKGNSEIFSDKNNNQYDFCSFNEKYVVDSWDFYERFKK